MEFYEDGAEYAVTVGSAGRVLTLAEGKLVEKYFNVDVGESDGAVVAVVLERKGSAHRYRTFVPIGPGVAVKRLAPEGDDTAPEPFRVPADAKALYFPDVPESEFGAVQPIVYEIAAGKAVVVTHEHGRTADGPGVFHVHVMLDSEDPHHPLHSHDERYGLSPVYGSVPSPIPGASS